MSVRFRDGQTLGEGDPGDGGTSISEVALTQVVTITSMPCASYMDNVSFT